ncbi:hypothetical protein VCHENC02_2872A, partial [Vibrio harveyi]
MRLIKPYAGTIAITYL